ncbi:hypothetical protein [Paenibacillus durus]|uniref:Uncharacterized protein n=1 Tax=Paenibacillus durus TaxID=44251 RepID=A0A089HJL2_PAEDU|nr:hypothetical protein [Paenibacillus durus]AIQ11287.1 hypothetical protein PDUR_04225 [Paenibacillus durus]
MELLTDEELKQMYIDEQAEAKIWQEELDFNKNVAVPMSGVPVSVPLRKATRRTFVRKWQPK